MQSTVVPRELVPNILALAASIYAKRARSVCYTGGQHGATNDDFRDRWRYVQRACAWALGKMFSIHTGEQFVASLLEGRLHVSRAGTEQPNSRCLTKEQLSDGRMQPCLVCDDRPCAQ